MVATPDEIEDEARRARRVRVIVDFTCNVILSERMARDEAEALVDAARVKILQLFPGREETYELLYAPRFRRLINEVMRERDSTSGTAQRRETDPMDGRGVVLPFRPRSA